MIIFFRGASISVKNATGNTPLMTAIVAGKMEVLLHMLKAINEYEKLSFRDIISLDAKNNKTLLNWAIEGNHTVLIEVSAGRTSLQIAIYRLITDNSPT